MGAKSFLHSTFRRRESSPSQGGLSFDEKIAAMLFASKRPDYYLYLADLIEGTLGRTSLIDIFENDAARYGNSARGKLSALWARQFDQGGGSLARTFAGTLPDEDVVVLDTLQRAGGEGALQAALRDLALNSELVAKAKSIVIITMFASLVCLSMVLAMVIAMPLFTVPKIADAFSMLPASFYPTKAVSLFAFADFIKANWLVVVLGFVGAIAACGWSMSNITGRVRTFLDKYGIAWGLYRDLQSIKFLSFLAAMLQKRGNSFVGLRDAIEMQLVGASRWKRYHVALMLDMIDHEGKTGKELFETGIMDQTMQWYIADLIEARGIEEALQSVRERLKDRVIKRISVQSSVLAWTLMIVSIFLTSYLMFWHLTVIDDMRKALGLYLS